MIRQLLQPENGVGTVNRIFTTKQNSVLASGPKTERNGCRDKIRDTDADTKITTFKCIIMSSEHPGDSGFRRVKMVHIYIDDQPVLVYYPSFMYTVYAASLHTHTYMHIILTEESLTKVTEDLLFSLDFSWKFRLTASILFNGVDLFILYTSESLP